MSISSYKEKEIAPGNKLSFGELESKAGASKFKKIKIPLSELDWSLPPIKWNSRTRPKPKIAEQLWEPEVVDELAKYIDFHGRHPHCVTPRKIGNTGGHLLGRKIVDDDLPGLFYTDNGVKLKPLQQEFAADPIGKDGDLEEVASVAQKTEYSSYISHGYSGEEDPWFIMSVKDHLESSHIDGSHTTVRRKPPKGKKLNAFEKEAAWQHLHYGEYEGGAPPLNDENKVLIDELALEDKKNLVKQRQKVSPWEVNHVYSKYCAKGTALKTFEKKALDDKVKIALIIHANPFQDDKSAREDLSSSQSSRPMGSRASSRQSFRKMFSSKSDKSLPPLSPQQSNSTLGGPSSSIRISSSKKSKRNKEKPKMKEKDPYDEMAEKLGGKEKLEVMETALLKLAKKIKRKAATKRGGMSVDTSFNLVEACDRLRVLKVTTLLLTGQAEAEMLSPDEESLFLYCFQRAIKLDTLSNHTRVEDIKIDTSDRKKLQKILDILLKYGARINSMKSKDTLAAIHIAVINDNVKMIDYLIKNKCNLNILTPNSELLTPLMIAAKYGHVHCIVRILEGGHDVNYKNPQGFTALHISALHGQTRTALFLLRVGAIKAIQDNEKRTAAKLAEEK
jgi:hypothetical protein